MMRALNGSLVLDSDPSDEGTEIRLTPYHVFYPLNSTSWLLMNTLTGALDFVDQNEKNLIESSASHTAEILSAHMQEHLVTRGYLARPVAEQRLLHRLAHQHEEEIANRKLEFFICPTLRCTTLCSYCYLGLLTKMSSFRLLPSKAVEAAFRAMNELSSATGAPVKEVILFGGEPLLPFTKETVRHILQRAEESGYFVSAFSSGLYIPNFISLLEEFRPIFKVLRTTLDGLADYHNSVRKHRHAFERTVEGIDSLLHRDIQVIVRTNVCRENLEVLPRLARFYVEKGWAENPLFSAFAARLKDRGCVGFELDLLREDDLALKFIEIRNAHPAMRYIKPRDIFLSLRHVTTNLQILRDMSNVDASIAPYKTIKFHGCGSTQESSYVFGTDGKVYVCTESVGRQEVAIGEFYPTFTIRNEQVARWKGWHGYNIPKCRECKFLLICGGTCALTSVINFGSAKERVCPPVDSILSNYVHGMSSFILAESDHASGQFPHLSS